MLLRRTFAAFLLACLAGVPLPASAQDRAPLTVFAAASMKEAIDAVIEAWKAGGHAPARASYAASGPLARQIEQGAPADLFISADEEWMGYLATRRGIRAETRRVIAGNALVLVAATRSARLVTIESGLRAEMLHIGGKFAIGDPRSVPAGAYAKAALERLGVWDALQPQLVMVENVRVALALVARGEAETGIVYASDAAAEPKVRVIGAFPAAFHPPIVYPAAVTATGTHPDAAAFLDFLGGPEARGIFRRLGFRVMEPG